MCGRLQLGLSLILAAVGCGSYAFAEDLSRPIALESEGRLDEALGAFEDALASSGNTREDLGTIYLHTSLLRFARNDHAGALDDLVRLLAVRRDISLPGSAPPEMEELLRQAEARWAARTLHAEVEADPTVAAGEQAVVHIAVIDDVAGMVSGARLLAATGPVAEVRGTGPFDIIVPREAFADRVVQLTVSLINVHGGTLWSGGSVGIRLAEDLDPVLPAPESTPGRVPALTLSGWLLLAAGAVAVTAGAVLVGVDSTPTGDTQDLPDGSVLEEQLDTVLSGWLLVGIGSAGVVAGIVLLLIRPRDPGLQESALRLARGVVAQW